MASGAGDAIALILAGLRVVVSYVAAKAFGRVSGFSPCLLKHWIDGRLAVTAFLQMCYHTPVAFLTIISYRAFLLVVARSSTGFAT
jgi:hypothetical protein